MNKIFFSYIIPVNFSGQSAATEILKDNLMLRGWNIDVLPLFPFNRAIRNPYKRLFYFFRNQLKIVPGLFRLISEKNPIIHISLGLSVLSFARVCIWLYPILILKRKVKLVITINGNSFMSWQINSLTNIWFLSLLRKASLITILGKRQMQRLLQQGINEEKLVIQFNPSGIEAVSQDYILQKHQQEHLNVLYLSLLIESKGFPEFLESILLLSKTNIQKSIHVTLCGPLASTAYCSKFKSSEEKERYIKSMLQLVKSEGNEKLSIEWIKGAFGVHKKKLFEKSHIFVLPTTFPVEAQPLVLIEAMASGNAIITTNVGEIKSILDEETAIFLETTEPESIANEILRLVENKERRVMMAINSNKRYITSLCLENYINSWEKHLINLN